MAVCVVLKIMKRAISSFSSRKPSKNIRIRDRNINDISNETRERANLFGNYIKCYIKSY